MSLSRNHVETYLKGPSDNYKVILYNCQMYARRRLRSDISNL